jgi:hypothetical protein
MIDRLTNLRREFFERIGELTSSKGKESGANQESGNGVSGSAPRCTSGLCVIIC